jgi:hypothetical protein
LTEKSILASATAVGQYVDHRSGLYTKGKKAEYEPSGRRPVLISFHLFLASCLPLLMGWWTRGMKLVVFLK